MQNAKRILLLDDHADLLDILKEALIYENFEVKAISCSNQMITIAQAYQPDVIIIDCHLSGCDSVTLCRAVKSDTLIAHIPVVICSAYINRDACAGHYGCDAVIAKPYSMGEMMEAITSVMVAL